MMLGRLAGEVLDMMVSPPRFLTTSSGSSTCDRRAICDQCRCIVRGIRYECLNCPNFDLCEYCVDNRNGKFVHAACFDAKHLFRAIGPKCSNNASSNRAKGHSRGEFVGLDTPFICDMCTHPITDVRHHCMKCSDFDTCGDCFQNSRDDHFFLHAFEEIGRKGKESKSGKKHGKSKSLEAPFQGGNPSSSTKAQPTTALSGVSSENAPGPQSFPQKTSYFSRELKQALSADIIMKSSKSSVPSAESDLTHPADCDFCSEDIIGTRYKCLDCPDFDTCKRCFSLVREQHPGHNFVEINHPDAVVSQSKVETDAITHNAICNSCHKQITGVRYKCTHPLCSDYDLCSKCESLPLSPHPTSHPLLKLKDHLTGPLKFDQESGVVQRKGVVVEGPEDAKRGSVCGTKGQLAGSTRISNLSPIEKPGSPAQRPEVLDIPIATHEGPTLDSPIKPAGQPLIPGPVAHSQPVEHVREQSDKQPGGLGRPLQQAVIPIVPDAKPHQQTSLAMYSESVNIGPPPVQYSPVTLSTTIQSSIHAQSPIRTSPTKRPPVKITPLSSPRLGREDANSPLAGPTPPISPITHWVSVDRPDGRPDDEPMAGELSFQHTISLQSPSTSESVTFHRGMPVGVSGSANVQFPSIPPSQKVPEPRRTQTSSRAAPARSLTQPSEQKITPGLHSDSPSQTPGGLGAGGIRAVPTHLITHPPIGITDLGKGKEGRRLGDTTMKGEPVVPSTAEATRNTATDALPTGRAPSTNGGVETRSRKAAGLRAAMAAQALAGGAARAASGKDGTQERSPTHPVRVPSTDSQNYVLADPSAYPPPPEVPHVTLNTGKLPGLPGPPPALPVPFTENQVYKTPDPFPHALTHTPSSETPFTTETKTQIQPVPPFSQNEDVHKDANWFPAHTLPTDSPFASSHVGGAPKQSLALSVAQRDGRAQGASDSLFLSTSREVPIEILPATAREVPIEILPTTAGKSQRPLPHWPVPQMEGQLQKAPDSASRGSTQVPSSPTSKVGGTPRLPTALPISEIPSLIPRMSACFVSNNTIRDGQIFPPGTYFEKSWRVKNNGTIPWPDGTALAIFKGDKLGAPGSLHVVPHGVQPDQVVDIAVILKAPDEPGRYLSYWKFMDHDSKTFGDRIWCDIVVRDPGPLGSKWEESRFFAHSNSMPRGLPNWAVHDGAPIASETAHSSGMAPLAFDYKGGSRG